MTQVCETNNYLICRVCLSAEEEKYMSLFEKYKCYRIFEYINILTNVNIQEFDGLPEKICRTCFFNLETAVSFKEKCENTNILLKSPKIKSLTDDSSLNVVFKRETSEIVLKIENKDDNYFETNGECELPIDEFASELIEVTNDAKEIRCNDIELSSNLNSLKNSLSQVQCHDCSGLFKSKCKLRVHWKKTHMLSALICTLCKRTFKTYKAMQMHLKKKNTSCVIAADKNLCIEGQGRCRIFHCKQCGYNTHRIKDMEAHLRIHSGDRPYQCDECPKRFTQQSSLQTHKECCHKDYIVEITCQFCGKVIRGRNKMYRHIKDHEQVRIKCSICKKIVFKRNLKTHMQRHGGVKSFTCEICAAAFYTIAELCNHRRYVHKLGELKKCPKCDFTVIKPHLLKKHLSQHTDKNFPCTVCGRFFLTVQKLTSHQKVHYEKKSNPCPLCDKVFLHKDSVRKHVSLKHPSYFTELKLEAIKNNEAKQTVTVTMIKTSPSS